MRASPESLAAIQQLRSEKKFVEENLYPGAPDEDIRLRCEASVNRFLDEFVTLLARDASKEQLLACAKGMLDLFAGGHGGAGAGRHLRWRGDARHWTRRLDGFYLSYGDDVANQSLPSNAAERIWFCASITG